MLLATDLTTLIQKMDVLPGLGTCIFLLKMDFKLPDDATSIDSA